MFDETEMDVNDEYSDDFPLFALPPELIFGISRRLSGPSRKQLEETCYYTNALACRSHPKKMNLTVDWVPAAEAEADVAGVQLQLNGFAVAEEQLPMLVDYLRNRSSFTGLVVKCDRELHGNLTEICDSLDKFCQILLKCAEIQLKRFDWPNSVALSYIEPPKFAVLQLIQAHAATLTHVKTNFNHWQRCRPFNQAVSQLTNLTTLELTVSPKFPFKWTPPDFRWQLVDLFANKQLDGLTVICCGSTQFQCIQILAVLAEIYFAQQAINQQQTLKMKLLVPVALGKARPPKGEDSWLKRHKRTVAAAMFDKGLQVAIALTQADKALITKLSKKLECTVVLTEDHNENQLRCGC